MTQLIYAGIDPGLNGGIAVLAPAGLKLTKTPLIGDKDYDIQSMKIILTSNRELCKINDHEFFVTIEKQMALPGQGLSSTFKTGQGFGIWLGLLAGLNIKYQIIPAMKWQKSLFVGMPQHQDTKVSSEIIAKRLFPEADFRRSERAFKADDGLTDATCIMEYGKRSYQLA